MSETLKPCPFCGSEAHEASGNSYPGEIVIRCTNELCRGEMSDIYGEASASELWNTRADNRWRSVAQDFYEAFDALDFERFKAARAAFDSLRKEGL